ncbi:PAS domain S-box protein [Natrinema caseinilyticum]|uniref:PAS domain S-box protein n=1 Tax=Natrinema caseinilyticum TaxID=2961570 RepID=UPI0020C47391|nr:PAS domain S-box protein [Natrinema caseinilyticum]
MSSRPLTESLRETLALFDGSGAPRTTNEVADRLDLGRRSTYDRLERLVDYGQLETKKVGASARVWWRSRPPRSDRAAGTGDGPVVPESVVEAVEEYAIFVLDADGYVRSWNAGAERIEGYAADDVLGEHVAIFYTQDDRDADAPESNLTAAAETGSIEDEGWRVRADGSRFWARVTITAIRDEDGTLEGYTTVTRDLTDRREREQQIRREHDLVERVLEVSPTGIGIFDDDGEPRRLNRRFTEYLGMDGDGSAEYALGDRPLLDEDGDEIPPSERPAPRALATGNPVEDQRVRIDDGATRWLSVNAEPLDGDSGVVVTMTDVTRLEEQTRGLERTREELETELEVVFDRVSEAFCALDDDFQFMYVNDRAQELFDFTETELLGANALEVLSVADDDPIRDRFEAAMATQTATSFQRYSEPLGIWETIRVYPSESGLSVYFTDITEHKERERELEQYERIVETIDDGVYAVDDEARFVMVNDGFCELTGYAREELLGESATMIHDDGITPRAETLSEEIATGDRDVANIELDVHTKGGETVPCESRLAPFPMEDAAGRCGVVRDISSHLEREDRLTKRVRQQEAVADLGQRALASHDVDALLAEGADRLVETLETDYCKVLDLDSAAESFLLREGVGWDGDVVGEATVPAVGNDSQAAYTLTDGGPVMVDDLATESRFGNIEDLTDYEITSGISVVIGTRADPWGILEVHDVDRRAFSDHDVAFVQSVANVFKTAIDRRTDERELERQREQLVALNNLNDVVHRISEAVVDRSTREEIERVVCDHLAESDSYLFSWIGDVDVATQTVNLRAEAGVEGYLDGITISADPNDERSRGATGKAIATGELQTTQDIAADSRYDPWRSTVEEFGFRSSAAIPIVHEETIYGVLNVYAERPEAFTGQERTVISRLGEVVGHAIAAAERKRALMSDDVVELQFRIRDVFESLGTGLETAGTITLDHTVPIENEEYLVYGTATEDAVETVESLVESLPHWTDVTFRSGSRRTNFELRLSEPPVLSTVASLGGSIEDVVIEDGDYRMSIHLAPGAEIRRIIDVVQSTYSGAELLKQRQVTRGDTTPERVRDVLSDDLTDRQRATLRAAYHAGFFEWPRDASGEDVAESLDIAPATFHQHLRRAQQKVFESLLSDTAAA